MVDLTELDGVGPARRDYLKEGGYETFEDIATGDPAEISEVIDAPEDTALELVVQSQNIMEAQESDESEDEPADDDVREQSITEEVEEAVAEVDEEETDSSDEAEPETEPEPDPIDATTESDDDTSDDDEPMEEDGDIVFQLEFESGLAYDTFFDAMMQQRSTMYQQNKTGVEAFNHGLEQMRNGDADEPVELELEEQQLNDLHNSVRQMSIEYKGNNLIDHMDALDSVYNQIEAVRSEHLF